MEVQNLPENHDKLIISASQPLALLVFPVLVDVEVQAAVADLALPVLQAARVVLLPFPTNP